MAFLYAIGAQRAHISGESLGGWVAARAAVDHPERIDRLVLNTAGGSQADPEVMKRIITLSMAAAEDPTWETVQARIKWLMADKSRDYDDIVASRQRVLPPTGFRRRDERHYGASGSRYPRTRTCSARRSTARSPPRRWWCGPVTTRPRTSPKGAACASMIPERSVRSRCPAAGTGRNTRIPRRSTRLHLDFLLGR